jgi:hypothetical protein
MRKQSTLGDSDFRKPADAEFLTRGGGGPGLA